MAAACDISQEQVADDSTSVNDVSSEVWTVPNNEVHSHDNQGQSPTEVHVVVSVQPEEKKPQRVAYQERRSGRIPTRKRSVPFKFRDYRNPDLVNEENEGEEAEEKFTPEEEFRNVSLVKRPATSSTRKRGRPRKLPQYEVPMTQEVITLDANTANSLGVGNEEVSIVIIQQGAEGGDIVLQTGGGQVLSGSVETNQIQSIPQQQTATDQSTNLPQQHLVEQTSTLTQQTSTLTQQTSTLTQQASTLTQHVVDSAGDKEQSEAGGSVENQSQGEVIEETLAVKSENIDSMEEDEIEESGSVESQEGEEEKSHMTQEGEEESQIVNSQDESEIQKSQKPQTVYLNKKPRRSGKKNNVVVVYSCGVCMKKFSSKGNLKTHMKIHLGEKPFHCNVENCPKSFRSNEALRRHKMSHLGIKPFECSFCNNKFSSNVSLQEHMSRHTDSKPHQCHICLRNFRQISCLRRHLITHSSETPFSCQICGRKFSQNMYLRSHMKMHTGERPFKCKLCDKAFAHQSDLNRHKIVHSGEKPYECEVCGTRFSDPSSKRRHEREHVGTKPYVCQLCYESFKRAGQLKAHLSRKHLHQKDDVQVIRTSTGALQFVFPNADQCITQQDIASSMSGDHPSMVKQKKIVKLIQDLNSSIQNVPINPPPHDYSATESPSGLDGDRQEEMSVESVISEALDKNQGLMSQGGDQRVQTLPVSTFDGSQMSESTVVTIAEVLDNGHIQTIQTDDCVPVEYLHIIEELAPESLEQQVVEVHYQDSEHQGELHTEQGIPKPLEDPPTVTPSASDQTSDTAAVDYASNPDFSSQAYYNWLCSFTELCKVMPMPLDVSLFQKISQVHKHLSDVMATPSGVVADKENFKTLMNISKELNTIINEHLFYVMQNLDAMDEK